MALAAGTVTIGMNADGSPTYSGSGLALARAQALVPVRAAGMYPLPVVGQTTAPFFPAAPCTAAMVASRKKGLTALYAGVQAEVRATATADIAYLTANAVLTVPAAGLLDHGGGTCSGTASGTLT
jgi:hypothetical protein